MVPLGVIAAVFVLPTYASCGGELHSPAYYASDGLFPAVWIAPVFLFAGLFAALTALALRRGQVDRVSRRLGLAALAALALSTVGVGAFLAAESAGSWPWFAAALLATAAAAKLVRRARGMGPWQIWEHLLAAFAVLAAATCPAVMLGGELLSGSLKSLGPGAYLFLGALAALWAVLGTALVRARASS